MSVSISNILNIDTNVQNLLVINPTVADDALRGAIRCNLVGFLGEVSVSTKRYRFAVGEKEARVIYLTPYNWKIEDGMVSLKRFLVGVKFQGDKGDENRITNYVLGQLEYKDPNYKIAKKETDTALSEGRRLTIAVTTDDIHIDFEKDHGGCILL